jgi:hypothetical protein
MPRCRMVVPETVRLSISDGDWLEVKKRLTHGERQRMFAMLREVGADGTLRPNLELLATGQAVAYLVDWSLVDLKGKPIPIETDAQRVAALNAFDEETVREIARVIGEHVSAMEADADAKKPTTDGATASEVTSPSVE